MPSAASSNHRWIHGPFADLMIGCGGFYAAGFAILFFMRDTASALHLGYLLPLALLFISLPH